MREMRIGPNEAGQRFDKYLKKYLKEAGSGFLYKMLRKKNITLNGARAEGSEKLKEGDLVRFFLADETIEKFRGAKWEPASCGEDASCGKDVSCGEDAVYSGKMRAQIRVIYEDDAILLADKPAGLLTQKASQQDDSLNDWLIAYLLSSGALTRKELETFRPSVCNRLDRNTSGLVICGKTLAGSQRMSELLRTRSIHKYYRLFVAGHPKEEGVAENWLMKDPKKNQVCILDSDPGRKDAVRIKTGWKRLETFAEGSYLEVELFTGKTHQIRAQMAALGYPLIGDPKYGNQKLNARFKKAGIQFQLLHAYRLEFPDLTDSPAGGRSFIAPEPERFALARKLLAEKAGS